MAASPSMDVPGVRNEEMLRSPYAAGIAFEVEISDMATSPPSSVPKRVQRRLLETPEGRSKSPSSLQEIQAKLKEADSRRQQFHEWLANKARPKVKSPPRTVQQEDLAERLQTKLVAAEQKRLELLLQEQTRLAKLEELRVAARTEVQLRAEREREELESRVESRVQQAETNRLALLEAEKQRRALFHERVANSVLQRTTQEGKDRERVEALRALICQKIAAAEEKRESLLKAERTRAQAVVLQARKVAKAVRRKRELELRNKKELLEARLQRAKRLRAEYLGQRGGCQGVCHNNGHKMKKHGDRLCRKLTRCWRQFRRSRRTTLMLAQDYAACNISHQAVLSLPFEDLAARITSPATLRSIKALLARIESRFMLSSTSSINVAKIDHLLKRLSPTSRKASNRAAQRLHGQGPTRGVPMSGSTRDGARASISATTRKVNPPQKIEEKEMERYPARVFLCAYMIIGHPEAVFSSRGEREVALSEAALKLVPEFEKLVSIILDGPSSTSVTGPSSPSFADQKKTNWDGECSGVKPFAAQLAEFDGAWCSYLFQFVAWKVQDAHLLEEDLIRVACQLELSMLQKCNFPSESDGADASHDSQAIQKQVLEDQQLLRERIRRLTGSEGVTRMEAALLEARNKCLEAREKGSPLPSPFASPQKSKVVIAPSLVSSDPFNLEPTKDVITPAKSLLNSFNHAGNAEKPLSQHPAFLFPQESATSNEEKDLDNERLVNELLHEPNWNIVSALHGASKPMGKLGEIQAQIKKTMEDAFWDGVLDGINREPPDYKRIVGLLEEMKTELNSLVPDAWKQELNESLDVDIFSQVLDSGTYDYEYCRKLLDYALGIVLKLGAPARDNDARTSHELLLKELSQISSELGETSQSSFALALVKGLRFVLQQVQVLKADISAARIQTLTPILQGSAGVEYLQKAFSKRYLFPESNFTEVAEKLPKTAHWLGEVQQILVQSKEEVEALRAVFRATVSERTSNGLLPTSSMRTGGRVTISKTTAATLQSVTGLEEHLPLQWHSFESSVKLGLLNLISGVQAVTENSIPETLSLNLYRLRKAQNEYQRLIILTTGLLLLRQNAAGKGVTGTKLDDVLKAGKEQLDIVLEDPSVSMARLGDLLAEVSNGSDSGVAIDGELMTSVLTRSLCADDAVFKRVSSAIQTGLKVIILLGTGYEGGALVTSALQRVGAGCLHNSIVDLGSSLERLASVSCLVHGPWYASLVSIN